MSAALFVKVGPKYLAFPSALPSPFNSLSTMADPFSLAIGVISLVTLALKLVVGAAGLIDKPANAHREAANELQELLRDLERLNRQMGHIQDKLQFLAADTKDRAFKNLLQEYVLSISRHVMVLI